MRKTLSIIWVLALLVTPAAFASSRIAIIFDDMGNRASDLEALKLRGDITYSILPHTPFSKQIARQAYADNRDVMLHIPMEALGGNPLGPGAITAKMSDAEIYQSLYQSLMEIPQAVGLNNHMGSKLTQLSRPMKTTMQFLKDNNLMFVDSRTTKYSRAETIAKQSGVEALHRHVFLDHYPAEKQIAQQFQRLVNMAKRNGFAIGIAHPYPVTVKVLREKLENLDYQAVQLVAASQLMEQRPDTQYAYQSENYREQAE